MLRTSCKPRANVQGSLTEPGIQAGVVIRQSSLPFTGIHKAPETNEYHVSGLNKYTCFCVLFWFGLVFLLVFCVRGEGRINYLCKTKLQGKNKLIILGFPQTSHWISAVRFQLPVTKKQLLKSLSFTTESSSKDLVQLDFTEMTGSVSGFNNEDFPLCLVLHAKFLCASPPSQTQSV